MPKEQFNFREKMNIFGGAFLGMAVPTFMFRYCCLGPSKTIGEEASKWATSLLALGNYAYITGAMGSMVGVSYAQILRYKRMEKEEADSVFGDKNQRFPEVTQSVEHLDNLE